MSFPTETASQSSKGPFSTLAPGSSRSRSLRGSPRRGTLIAGMIIGVASALWLMALLSNGILSRELVHTPTPTASLVPAGIITEFPLPIAQSQPDHIIVGPNGNFWFTEFDGNKIGRISPSGTITEFPLPAAQSSPLSITAGPDGNLWFIEDDGKKIGRITSGR